MQERSPGAGQGNSLYDKAKRRKDPLEQVSMLAWRIPWTDEPWGLLSIGSHRVRQDWRDLACTHIEIPCTKTFNQLSFFIIIKYQHLCWALQASHNPDFIIPLQTHFPKARSPLLSSIWLPDCCQDSFCLFPSSFSFMESFTPLSALNSTYQSIKDHLML